MALRSLMNRVFRANDCGSNLPSAVRDEIREVDQPKEMLLHYAVRDEKVTMVKLLVDRHVEVNVRDVTGITPLGLAVEKKNYAMMKILLEAKANIYVTNRNNISILQEIASYHTTWIDPDPQQMNVMKMTLERVKSDCQNEPKSMAKVLLDSRVPLYLVVQHIRNVQITKLMLQAGRSANEPADGNGMRPLHAAVEIEDLCHVKLLVRWGCDVKLKDQRGRAPLDFYNPLTEDTPDKVQILKILSIHGAFHIQPISQSKAVRNILLHGQKDSVHIVIDDIDLLSKDEFKNTPLHYLVQNLNPGVFDAITPNRFFMPNDRNDCSQTVLMVAALSGSLQAVQCCLENGANVNLVDDVGFTPLFHVFVNNVAAFEEKVQMIKLLLIYGADVQYELDNHRTTIIEVGKEYGGFVMLQTVLDHLAMLELTGHGISPLIRSQIDRDLVLKAYYYWIAKPEFMKILCHSVKQLNFDC